MATRSRFLFQILPALAATWLALTAPPVWADGPGSPIRIMQETVIRVGPKSVLIDYTVTMNQAAAYLEVLKMDADGDGALSPEEQNAYFDEIQKTTAGALDLLIEGTRMQIRQVGEVELAMPFKKLYRFKVDQPADWQEGVLLEFHNDNFLEFTGPITIALDPGTGADIVYHSLDGLPADSESPNLDSTNSSIADLESDPATCPQQRDVVFRYRRGTGRVVSARSAKPFTEEVNSRGLLDQPSMRPTATRRRVSVPLASVVLLLGAPGILCLVWRRTSGRRAHVVLVGMALLAMGFLPTAFQSSGFADSMSVAIPLPWSLTIALPDADEAERIFRHLHRNIYKAFDAKTESEVYDVLAESLNGELLETVYNEVYDAKLMRKNAAGDFNFRRIKVIASDVRLPKSARRAAYRVRHRWQVYGTVTHIGHVHSRLNQYDAVFTVAERNGQWRIVDVNVQQHERFTRG